MIQTLVNLLTIAALAFGLFFLFIGALGIWRLPDVFNRMHAGSKCLTLGVSGALLAAVLHFATLYASPETRPEGTAGKSTWVLIGGAAVKAALVILFQYTTAPVGAHMLARAAHVDGADKWKGTMGDELEEDRGGWA